MRIRPRHFIREFERRYELALHSARADEPDRLVERPDEVDVDGEPVQVDELELDRADLPNVVERALRADGGEKFAPDAGEEVTECPHCGENVPKHKLRCWFCARFLRKPTVTELRELCEGSGMGDPMASEKKQEVLKGFLRESKIRTRGSRFLQVAGTLLTSWWFWAVVFVVSGMILYSFGQITGETLGNVVEFFFPGSEVRGPGF